MMGEDKMGQSILEEAKSFFDKAMELKDDRYGSKKVPILTTSQLRNFLNDVVNINNRVEILRSKRIQAKDESNELPQELQNSIEFLDVKLMYQVGRNNDKGALRKFYEKGDMASRIKQAKKGITEYKRFADLMEAVVALHKYHGGKD
ncbi:type III-A CRISPR-associated protein Csm2 [Pectinatus frisingensis]|uniref:type III-A CRISPR-associated protein Csm2 n=1 Tax=Pectinatus frisingensis TaxID=865 RepID=UPI001E2D4098|nr:type III-A CRISPR-associated protein Csm2 [Pectinatus frisingensis]